MNDTILADELRLIEQSISKKRPSEKLTLLTFLERSGYAVHPEARKLEEAGIKMIKRLKHFKK